jgi:hypothetical protein
MRKLLLALGLMLWASSAFAQSYAISVPNEGATGTTIGLLAKLTGAPSTAINILTSDSSGIIGVVVGETGASAITGNAIIATVGLANCTFDNSTTAGHYVQASGSTAANCHDTGAATVPTSGQIIGIVLASGSAGSYQIALAGSGLYGVVGSTGCTVSGAAGAVFNNGSSACTTDTSITATAGALSLGASGVNGSVIMGNATSGTATIRAATGALGTTVLQVPGFNATATVAATDVADQTITGGANVTSASQSTGNITIDCGKISQQYMTNGGSFTVTAPTNDGNCILDIENNGSAGTVSVSGFSPNSIGGATLDTTNGHNFRLYISRIHAHSSIFAVALQ